MDTTTMKYSFQRVIDHFVGKNSFLINVTGIPDQLWDGLVYKKIFFHKFAFKPRLFQYA